VNKELHPSKLPLLKYIIQPRAPYQNLVFKQTRPSNVLGVCTPSVAAPLPNLYVLCGINYPSDELAFALKNL